MKILLFPIGGLANRMRTIDSAVNFSEYHQYKLKIFWIRDNGLNCKFSKIWIPIPFIKDSKGLIAKVFFYLFRRYKFFKWIMKILEDINLVKVIIDNFVGEKEEIHKYAKSRIENSRYCYMVIKTCEGFYPSTKFRNNLFKLQPAIEQKVNNESKTFNNRTIGVHIRRKDNNYSVENSPLELFVERISKVMSDNPESSLYITSDDPDTKEFFLQSNKWKNKVIIPKGNIARNTENGIIQAVVELYSLSHTRKIIGSYWSSYSEIAAQIGDIDIEIVSKEV